MISVTANILPNKVVAICNAVASGNISDARSLHYELMDINDTLFIDTNPVPVKAALHLMGKIENELRAPLLGLSGDHLEKVKKAMTFHGLPVTK